MCPWSWVFRVMCLDQNSGSFLFFGTVHFIPFASHISVIHSFHSWSLLKMRIFVDPHFGLSPFYYFWSTLLATWFRMGVGFLWSHMHGTHGQEHTTTSPWWWLKWDWFWTDDKRWDREQWNEWGCWLIGGERRESCKRKWDWLQKNGQNKLFG